METNEDDQDEADDDGILPGAPDLDSLMNPSETESSDDS